MDDISEYLKISICSILKSISEETINTIIATVKYVGVESLPDLQFMEEEDLVLVLKPIYRRKLVKLWIEQTVTEDEASSLQLRKLTWKHKNVIRLLQIYTKYKIGFTYPGIEEQNVWNKIADELRKKYSLMCDEQKCRYKIDELRHYYRKIKNKIVTTEEAADFLDKAKIAFENPVHLKSLDELLKPNIRSILNSLTEETVCGIIDALKYAGLRYLSDLQYVKQEDLLLVLRPIQRRKLVKAWSKPVIPTIELPENESEEKCKWLWERCIVLLRLYTMYKAKFSSQNVDDQRVWEKIAKKLKVVFPFELKNCDASQCKNQIYNMKREYKKKKKRACIANDEKEAFFLDEAKLAFEIQEKTVSFSETPLQENEHKVSTLSLKPNWVWFGEKYLALLQVYIKYKTELTSFDDENQKVWGKISKEVTEKCSSYCGESRCRYEINCLRRKYEHFKNSDGEKAIPFFKEVQKAFETTKYPEAEAENELKEKTAEQEIETEKDVTPQSEEKSSDSSCETGVKQKIEEIKEPADSFDPKKAVENEACKPIEEAKFYCNVETTVESELKEKENSIEDEKVREENKTEKKAVTAEFKEKSEEPASEVSLEKAEVQKETDKQVEEAKLYLCTEAETEKKSKTEEKVKQEYRIEKKVSASEFEEKSLKSSETGIKQKIEESVVEVSLKKAKVDKKADNSVENAKLYLCIEAEAEREPKMEKKKENLQQENGTEKEASIPEFEEKSLKASAETEIKQKIEESAKISPNKAEVEIIADKSVEEAKLCLCIEAEAQKQSKVEETIKQGNEKKASSLEFEEISLETSAETGVKKRKIEKPVIEVSLKKAKVEKEADNTIVEAKLYFCIEAEAEKQSKMEEKIKQENGNEEEANTPELEDNSLEMSSEPGVKRKIEKPVVECSLKKAKVEKKADNSMVEAKLYFCIDAGGERKSKIEEKKEEKVKQINGTEKENSTLEFQEKPSGEFAECEIKQEIEKSKEPAVEVSPKKAEIEKGTDKPTAEAKLYLYTETETERESEVEEEKVKQENGTEKKDSTPEFQLKSSEED